uniref:Uncharacterized protein n=1 Tax=Kalanchoe fedtschenkoi TaxID=63787 RepID=A0A7N0U835_KALFE
MNRKNPFACCFAPQSPIHHSLTGSDSPSSSSSASPSYFAEMKQKHRSLMKHRLRRRPRRLSADFSYDPVSYALNFEDVGSDDRLPLRNFPATPPRVGRSFERGVAACG